MWRWPRIRSSSSQLPAGLRGRRPECLPRLRNKLEAESRWEARLLLQTSPSYLRASSSRREPQRASSLRERRFPPTETHLLVESGLRRQRAQDSSCCSAVDAEPQLSKKQLSKRRGESPVRPGAMAQGGGDWKRLETLLRDSLRVLRSKWGQQQQQQPGRLPESDDRAGEEEEEKQTMTTPNALEALPIDVKLYIMSFLTPKDLSNLGSTNRYWSLTIQDPLLWRYFLIHDLPSCHSVDWKSVPDANIFNKSVFELHNSASCDYMAAYKKCYSRRKRCPKASRPYYGPVTSFLQSLTTQAEPRFAMFGPGLENLDDSLVHRMMASPHILPLAGRPSRQMHGIGSGVTFRLNGQKFVILILYTKTSKERLRAKEEDTDPVNKMFSAESSVDGKTQHNLTEHVKNMCRQIDGFIYAADAEADKRQNRQLEFDWLAAMLDPALGPTDRPLLVLSCVSCAEIERIPCVYMAHQLQLNLLGPQPWMVQDTEVSTLDGLVDGIQWLLEQTECKNAQ
nr:F-box only protein 4-like [Zootoca vivipara]